MSPGSARVSRVGFGVSPKQSLQKSPRWRDAIARHARRVRYPEGIPRRARYISLRAFFERIGSPHKNARASPAKWREPVIRIRSFVVCAAVNASASDGVMEWGSDGVLKEKMEARSCGGSARSLRMYGSKNFVAIGAEGRQRLRPHFCRARLREHGCTIGTELFPPRLRKNSRAGRIVRAIDDYCFIPDLKTCWPLNRLETARNRIIRDLNGRRLAGQQSRRAAFIF